jgi:hypothetical protein
MVKNVIKGWWLGVGFMCAYYVITGLSKLAVILLSMIMAAPYVG